MLCVCCFKISSSKTIEYFSCLEKKVLWVKKHKRGKNIQKVKKNSDAIVEVLFEREAWGFVLSFLSREGEDKEKYIKKERKEILLLLNKCVCECVSVCCVTFQPFFLRIKPKHNNLKKKSKNSFCFHVEKNDSIKNAGSLVILIKIRTQNSVFRYLPEKVT